MININRHNYEEFFLLYTDRELSSAERMAVEQFVQDNPDLADEFATLQQSTLPADEAILMDKSMLYRNASNEIGLHNHTEQFLLYVDDELSADERNAVETFVLQHPALQETFIQFKQTKLPPEQVIFPDKNSLYRSVSEKKPVVYMQWMRMVAAAAIIGFGFFIWTIAGDNSTANNNTQLAAVTGTKTVRPGTANNAAVGKAPEANSGLNTGLQEQSNSIISQNRGSALQQLVAVNIPSAELREDLKTVPELVIERQNAIHAEESAKPVMDIKTFNSITANAAITENDMIKTAGSSDAESNTEKDALAQQVVYKELDTETDSNNKSLLIGSVEINKDKLRGLFRKASSIFRSKKSEDTETTGTGTSRPLK